MFFRSKSPSNRKSHIAQRSETESKKQNFISYNNSLIWHINTLNIVSPSKHKKLFKKKVKAKKKWTRKKKKVKPSSEVESKDNNIDTIS